MHVYFFICSFSWFPKFYSTWAKKEDWFRRHRHGWGSMPTMANPDDDCWPWDKINEDFCRGFSSSIFCRKLRMAGGAWLFSWGFGKHQPANHALSQKWSEALQTKTEPSLMEWMQRAMSGLCARHAQCACAQNKKYEVASAPSVTFSSVGFQRFR